MKTLKPGWLARDVAAASEQVEKWNMSANKRQIGGSHYASALQHWDVVEDHGIGYLEGCASKYISRWRKKNGLQDLEKGLHFTDKTIELALTGRGPRGEVPLDIIERFVIANDLELMDKAILVRLWRWRTRDELQLAAYWFQQLINEEKRNAQSKAGG